MLCWFCHCPGTLPTVCSDSSNEVFSWASKGSPAIWQIIALQDALQQLTSHSEPWQLLAAATAIKTGDLSGPCVCAVGELWPHKYASDTPTVPIIESQPICLVMHMILKAKHCAYGHYSSLNFKGSHLSHDFYFVITGHGKQSLALDPPWNLLSVK